jgi:imidazolonepropionase-like amidohydrolase
MQRMSALHVRGVTLPGERARDLWVVDGRISETPVADADTVAEGWIVPGLVDAHCHIGIDANGAVDEATQERQALADRDAGVLLARDCGVAADTRWIDGRADLPRIVRAGRHIAVTKRYVRNYAVEVAPEQLVEAVVEQAGRGDGWVKIVGDWIDREIGDLAPCWPTDVLTDAIAAAHEHGARVTTHVFGEDALPGLLAAGIDCIEHGTALNDEQLALMADRGIALVPTLINIETFPDIAARADKFPTYAAHMLALHKRVAGMVARAHEAGVPIYAGTDAGGVLAHGLIADEVRALIAAGVPAETALGAASWSARQWLGYPGTLDDGTEADFVVYADDPRRNPDVLAEPLRIVLRGAIVR